ncbi:MAG: hypothetical protein V4577_26425 [Bacteroidota bacterium]
METIFWISAILFIIALISVVAIVRKHNKLYANKDQIPGLLDDNDISKRGVDFLRSEQPFVDYY